MRYTVIKPLPLSTLPLLNGRIKMIWEGSGTQRERLTRISNYIHKEVIELKRSGAITNRKLIAEHTRMLRSYEFILKNKGEIIA